jgi:hypothetical protein
VEEKFDRARRVMSVAEVEMKKNNWVMSIAIVESRTDR